MTIGVGGSTAQIELEKLKNMTAVVFDKTGTITNNDKMSVQYFGAKLSEKEAHLIYKTTKHLLFNLHLRTKNLLK